MSDQMEFPKTFDEFAEDFGFKDREEIYTNGAELIPVFRVKQWLEHDNKLRTIETDTAYECGKHANKWIPVSERLPKQNEYVGDVCKYYLIQDEFGDMHVATYTNIGWIPINTIYALGDEVIAWMPLPKPYKREVEE